MSEDEKNRASLAVNARWYLVANVIGSIYAVLVIPILTHYLSAEEFGFYILIAQIVSVLQTIGLIFFSQSLFRFHVEWEGHAKQVFYGTMLISVLAIELILSGILFYWRRELLPMAYPNINLPLDPYIGWTCVWLVLTSVRVLTLTKIKAEERPVLALVMNLSYGVFLSVAMYSCVVKMGGGLAAALISFVIAELGAFLCVGFYVWKSVQLAWRPKILWQVARFSFPLALSSILFILSVNMDRKVLAEYLSLSELGVYGIGFTIGNILSLVVSSYAGTFTPRGFKVWKMGGRRPLENLVQSGLMDSVIVVGIALGCVMIFGSYIAYILNKGDTSGPVVAVATGIGAGHMVRLIFIYAQNVLFIGERTEKILILNCGLLFVTWLMAHFLSNAGGEIAASFSIACSYLIVMPLAFSMAKSICAIRPPWKIIARLGLGLVIIAGLEFILPNLSWGSLLSESNRKILQIIILILSSGITLSVMVSVFKRLLVRR